MATINKIITHLKTLGVIFLVMTTTSCATSKAITSYGTDLSKYSYIVFGEKSTGDETLEDLMMAVHNEIAKTRLQIITAEDGINKIMHGENVLSPSVDILTEKRDGGHSYITITFYDYSTNQKVAIVKSSGIGFSINQDQQLALKAIKKKLKSIFGYQE